MQYHIENLSFENNDSVDMTGASHVGEIITTYDDLVEAFGEPSFDKPSDDVKGAFKWTLEFKVPVGEDGDFVYIPAIIYAWKAFLRIDGEYDFFIVAHDSVAFNCVNHVKNGLKEKKKTEASRNKLQDVMAEILKIQDLTEYDLDRLIKDSKDHIANTRQKNAEDVEEGDYIEYRLYGSPHRGKVVKVHPKTVDLAEQESMLLSGKWHKCGLDDKVRVKKSSIIKFLSLAI